MITRNVEGKESLDIFENFQVDYGLPKYKKEKSDTILRYSNEGSFIINNSSIGLSQSNGPRPNNPPIIRNFFKNIYFKYKNWRAEEPEKVLTPLS